MSLEALRQWVSCNLESVNSCHFIGWLLSAGSTHIYTHMGIAGSGLERGRWDILFWKTAQVSNNSSCRLNCLFSTLPCIEKVEKHLVLTLAIYVLFKDN